MTAILMKVMATSGGAWMSNGSSRDGNSNPFFMFWMTSIHFAAPYPRASDCIRRLTFSPSEGFSRSNITRTVR